jgi:hypothetical protein
MGNYSKIIERKENGIRDLMEKLVRLIDEIYEDGANAKSLSIGSCGLGY